MELHIVGTGCPSPVPDQFGSAFALQTAQEILLVDCGPATTYKLARMGISPHDIDHVFLTHHHFDHNVDLPCLALTRWDLCTGGEPPLCVYGPRPTQRFVDLLLRRGGAFAQDWQARIDHPASHACHELRGGTLPRPGPRIGAVDLQHGQAVETAACRVTAARVRHVEPSLASLAYRVEAEGSSIVFAGDCADCDELRELAAGAASLVMACTHFGAEHTRPEIAAVITGTPEAAAVANASCVGRLVLTHVSPNFSRPGMRERAVADIARQYHGEIVFPREFETVVLT